MNDYIVKLNNIKIVAAHGLHDIEKTNKQLFEVDVAISFSKENCNDDINQSIDYEYLYNLIVKVFKQNSVNLIEYWEIETEESNSLNIDSHRFLEEKAVDKLKNNLYIYQCQSMLAIKD